MSKIFVEHALHVARLQFRTQAQQLCVGYCRLSYDYQFINKGMLAFERQLDKSENKIDHTVCGAEVNNNYNNNNI